MGTFGARLGEALRISKKTRAQLAKVLWSATKNRMGVSAQAVGQAISGTTRAMTAENVARAARFLRVDFYWLATGEGTARPSKTPEAVIGEIVLRLGELLTGADDLTRTTAASLLSQLANTPSEAARIATVMEALTARPVESPRRPQRPSNGKAEGGVKLSARIYLFPVRPAPTR